MPLRLLIGRRGLLVGRRGQERLLRRTLLRAPAAEASAPGAGASCSRSPLVPAGGADARRGGSAALDGSARGQEPPALVAVCAAEPTDDLLVPAATVAALRPARRRVPAAASAPSAATVPAATGRIAGCSASSSAARPLADAQPPFLGEQEDQRDQRQHRRDLYASRDDKGGPKAVAGDELEEKIFFEEKRGERGSW